MKHFSLQDLIACGQKQKEGAVLWKGPQEEKIALAAAKHGTENMHSLEMPPSFEAELAPTSRV